jgi:two-component system response regulator RegX3
MADGPDAPGGEKAERPFILIVEDDQAIAELVAAYLLREGTSVDLAASAEAAQSACGKRAYGLVLLDLGLPGADGLEFLRWFRQKSLSPVIIVSARESDEDKVAGLGLGADDFVSKPFSPRVLVARVMAQLRRASYSGAEPGSLAFGPFRLDFKAKVLEREGERVPLSKREFELLAFLARNEGQTFSPAELYSSVWRLEHGDLSTVAVHVQRVRHKIEDDPQTPRWLQTLPGLGYRFVKGPA